MTVRPLALLNATVVLDTGVVEDNRTVLVEDGIIKAIEGHVAPSLLDDAYDLIDCSGKVLLPGLVDMKVHTGEPGNEHEETLESASRAAVAGGVTTMVVQPDTSPVIDDMALVEFVLRNARATAVAKVHAMGALTKGLDGAELSELRLMHEAGAVAFSNGNASVENALVFRRALSYARDFDGLIIHHAEDASLSQGGVMNESEMATRLGLPGIPKAAEIIMLERDIRLTKLTGGRYHASAISCAESVEIIKRAKDHGLKVTCGASINNVALNENDIGPYRTFFKVSPPLRPEDDRQAIIDGIKDGTIDVVHSDHRPRDVDMKRHPFADAADGAIGLETLLPAMLRLFHDDVLTLPDITRVLCQTPATLLNANAGRIAKGSPADFTLVDLHEPWVLREEDLQSRSKNTSFEGARFTGRVLATYVDGIEAYRRAGF
ncbi:MAG: dihydroorotase [Pseudomonadota bacterium]